MEKQYRPLPQREREMVGSISRNKGEGEEKRMCTIIYTVHINARNGHISDVMVPPSAELHPVRQTHHVDNTPKILIGRAAELAKQHDTIQHTHSEDGKNTYSRVTPTQSKYDASGPYQAVLVALPHITGAANGLVVPITSTHQIKARQRARVPSVPDSGCGSNRTSRD